MRSLRPARPVAGAAALALIAMVLTGCSGPAAAASCSPLAGTGVGAESVTATGAFATAPTVRFPTPLSVTSTEVTPLIAGSGAPIQSKQEIVADLTILNGTTGAVVTKTEYSGVSSANAFVIGKVPVKGLAKALTCARVGERLAAVIPPKEGLSAATRGTEVSATDSIVVVADIRRAYLARADGRDQVMSGGLPAVVLGSDGRPGITLPEGNPPATLQVADLKKGSGPLISEGDTAIVHYTGVVWKPGDAANGTVFDSSWTTGSPVAFPVKTASVIPGFVKALAGQRVGSQVLAVIPPSQAYGSKGSTSVPGGATLVFVVDVLGKG